MKSFQEGVSQSLKNDFLVETLIEHYCIVVHELQDYSHISGETLSLFRGDANDGTQDLINVQKGQEPLVLNKSFVDKLIEHKQYSFRSFYLRRFQDTYHSVDTQCDRLIGKNQLAHGQNELLVILTVYDLAVDNVHDLVGFYVHTIQRRVLDLNNIRYVVES